jgi:tetratricopeptide (TPR) repeat protein
MVGREQEIGLLMERWRLAQDGDGQVVLLSGEPGIGKSRILSALRERLEALGGQPLRFQCSPYYGNSAFWPSIDNFERALKFGRDEPAETKLDKLESLMVGQRGRPLGDVRFIASMLSIPSDKRYGPHSMIPQKFKDETLRVLVDLSEATARRQPSVMLYEDVHWADPSSLEVLDLLIDRVKSFPLLIVITHRPEFQSRWSHHGHVISLNLSKLTRSQSAAMVAGIAGDKALAQNIVEQILAKTDGVPLFVEELTKSVVEGPDFTNTGDQRGRPDLSNRQIAIPTTLRDSLMARLDRFMPVKEIAQIGAVVGRDFSYELISAVAPMPAAQLDEALARLIESGLAFRRGTPPEATYSFKHALVQDAAYDSLLKSRRQELHGRIARVIRERFPSVVENNPEVLARHYTQAHDNSNAIPLWQKAGELALSRFALSEAISHFNEGLENVATLPESAERDIRDLALRVPLGTAWQALKGWAASEVREVFEPAARLAQTLNRSEVLLHTLFYLMLNTMTQGRVSDSEKWLNEIQVTVTAAGDPDVLIYGSAAASIIHFWAGRLTETVKAGEKVLARYDEQKHRYLADVINHDFRTISGTYCSIVTWMLGYPDRAARLVEENETHARRRAHPFDLGYAVAMHANHVFNFRGEPGEIWKRAEICDRLGRDNSIPPLSLIMAALAKAYALLCDRNPAEAIPIAEAALAAWESSGGTSTIGYARALLAEQMALAGDLEGAVRQVEQQIEMINRPGWGERIFYAEILRLKGSILSIKGDLEGAEQAYKASLDWAREQEAKSWELRTSMGLARLWQSQGKSVEAYELLAPVYNWFTEGFDTADLKEAKALLRELE